MEGRHIQPHRPNPPLGGMMLQASNVMAGLSWLVPVFMLKMKLGVHIAALTLTSHFLVPPSGLADWPRSSRPPITRGPSWSMIAGVRFCRFPQPFSVECTRKPKTHSPNKIYIISSINSMAVFAL